MKKFGPIGMKWLKVIHIILVALFFGGVMSSFAFNYGFKLATYDETFENYKRIVIISDQIVRIGAVGTLLVGFIYGIFTNWGFFRHRWITVKWILFITQTVIGIFIVDKLMMANMAMLEEDKAAAINNPVFIHNHTLRQYAVMGQIVITIIIFCISVFKPWKKKRSVSKHTGIV